ncbi:response regulator [Rugamonas sp.]|uniref:response regulator n=1 Tax=Rugamonas sp. TaxID=1926287 RepID=UPI0025D6799E|nr:response regulator [Rugamonas sp.]
MTRLLLLDDEAHMLQALRRELRLLMPDVQIECFTNPYEAINRVCVCEFDLVIADYRMPEMSGVAFLQALRDIAPDTVRMMLSASTEFDIALSAINDAQVFRFIPKPWQPAELEANIRLALQLRARLLAEREPARAASDAAQQSAQELEAQRLEREEPGILRVKRTPDGSIIL